MNRSLKIIIAGLSTAFFGLILAFSPIGSYLEETIGLKLLFLLRGVQPCLTDVIFVNINDLSTARLDLENEPDEWSRRIYAELLDRLQAANPALVVFDIVFDEIRDIEADHLFSESIKRAGNVILCESIHIEKIPIGEEGGGDEGFIDMERLIYPAGIFAESALACAPFPLPKVPLRVNKSWAFKKIIDNTIPTLPCVAFQVFSLKYYKDFLSLLCKVNMRYSEILPDDPNIFIRDNGIIDLMYTLRDIFKNDPSLSKRLLKEMKDTGLFWGDNKKSAVLRSLIRMYSEDTGILINFYGPSGTVPNIPLHKVLNDDLRGMDLKGKAVFVGLAELYKPGKEDYFHTVYSQANGVELSGVEIASTIFANLVEGASIKQADSVVHFMIILIFGLCIGILCYTFQTIKCSTLAAIAGLFYIILAVLSFKSYGRWYPLIIPLFIQIPFAFVGTLLWKYMDAVTDRANIKKAIGYYLPSNLVDQLAKDIEHIKSTSQTVYGVCLITDAEKYTTLSEMVTPFELSKLLNNYYEVVFQPVRKYGGMVSAISGDSMLAIWISDKPDAKIRNDACCAAIEIIKGVQVFNESFGDLQLPTRIGLHAGYMVLGNVGAVDHYEYTPLGDIVNTSSRLEGLNKHLKTQILVSEDVLFQLDGFDTRELGNFLLAGKKNPILIFELFSLKTQMDEVRRKQCAIFANALDAFKNQLWDDAILAFKNSIAVLGSDGPSEYFLRLCEEYKRDPPLKSWDGLIRVEKK